MHFSPHGEELAIAALALTMVVTSSLIHPGLGRSRISQYRFARPLSPFLYFAGLFLELLDLLKLEGIPHLSTVVNATVLVDAIAILLAFLGSLAMVGLTSVAMPLPKNLIKILLAMGTLAQLPIAFRIYDAARIGFVSPNLMLSCLALIAVLVGVRSLRRSTFRLPSFGGPKSWTPLAGLLGAGALTFVVVALPNSLQAKRHTNNASSNAASALGLSNSGRVGASSDSDFSSGILPTDADGTNVPIILPFSGNATVGNPNLHQVVKVRFAGGIDGGRVGNFAIFANGVPQPDGFLSITQSKAILRLKIHHQIGFGSVSALSSKAVAGVLHFANGQRYQFALSTIASPTNHLEGRLTLIAQDNGSKSTSNNTGVA